MLVAVAACGSSDTESEATTTVAPMPSNLASTSSTSSGPTTTVSVATLTQRLLTVGDLPSGWQLASPINEMDLVAFANLPCDNAAINPLAVKRLTASTGIQFEPVGAASGHMIELVTTGDPTQLAKDVGMLIGAREEACSGADATSDGAPLTITQLPLPSTLGDQRNAYSGHAGPESTWFGRSAVVCVGGIAVMIGLTEVRSSPTAAPTISDAAFVQLVQTAVQRLEG